MVINFEKKINVESKIRVGTNIIKQLSTTFYPNLNMVFSELVSNARDAMATKVRIRVGDDKITIEDNGEGMTHDDLIKFFYISHTDKEEGNIKIRGDLKRELIGKFGIGKLTLYRLCKSFDIIS